MTTTTPTKITFEHFKSLRATNTDADVEAWFVKTLASGVSKASIHTLLMWLDESCRRLDQFPVANAWITVEVSSPGYTFNPMPAFLEYKYSARLNDLIVGIPTSKYAMHLAGVQPFNVWETPLQNDLLAGLTKAVASIMPAAHTRKTASTATITFIYREFTFKITVDVKLD